mgnify:CR=1 FL=1
MEFILYFILHIDQYMIDIVQEYHTWTYVILFIIIFCDGSYSFVTWNTA